MLLAGLAIKQPIQRLSGGISRGSDPVGRFFFL